MTSDTLREFAKREPFEPFTIHMNDGSRLRVTQPDNLLVPRQWNFMAIIALDKGRWSEIYIRNIAHISTRGKWPKMGGKRRRGGNGSAREGDDS